MAATLLPLLFLTGQLRAQSALDGFDPKADGTVEVVVVQPDGKILIGGDFTTLSPNGGPAVTRNRIARLNPDGTLDTAFNPNAADFPVYAIALQADGKILVGGGFTSIGGQIRHRVARLDSTTGLADSFDPNMNANVLSIAVQGDGKILVGGNFHGPNSVGGETRNYIARIDPTTGVADSFNPNANDSVLSVAVQADGKILAGGAFSYIGGSTRNGIARLNAATAAADAWNPNAIDWPQVRTIALQADGKILVGGLFGNIGGQPRARIARLDPMTGAADSFDPHAFHSDPGFRGSVNSIAVQPDGKILAAGSFTDIGGQARNSIARLNPITGSADSFDPNSSFVVDAVAVQQDGKIVMGGLFTTVGGQPRHHIARLESDGRVDQTLNPIINGTGVQAIAVQPDGKILIGGDFSSVAGMARRNIARLNTDGTLDMAFHPTSVDSVLSITVQADGKILVGGHVYRENSLVGITRLDAATGLVDDSFNPDTDNVVSAIAVQADGKILIGGGITGESGLSRLNPDGTVDSAFDPNVSGFVSILMPADGKILAGGVFSSVGGQNRNNIARLDAPAGAVDSFDPNADGPVNSIAVQADGRILAGGRFASIGGQTRNGIARLDATTGTADLFDPNADNTVASIVVQADGKIVAGGDFETIGGQSRNHIARLDATTGLPDLFDPNVFGYVSAIAVQADGKILASGGFGSIGGESRFLFARLSNDTAALQDLAVRQTTITWTLGGSSPRFTRVTFEYSNDNVNYTALGHGTAAGSNWTLTSLSLPIEQNFYIRARGYFRSNNSESITESVRNAFIPKPGTLGNISTRLRVQTGDNAMIGGFIITGTQPKTVIVRGIGPSLPIPGALADPVIEVHGSSGQLLATNDNWNDSLTRQQIIDSGLAPSNALESALWGTINPGAYTVVVRGINNTTGIALFEVYDLDQTADSKLANISTRGFVETGDHVLIGGMIVIGENPLTAIVRAMGPSLPVPGALGDPILELYDGNGGLIAVNYNWRDDQEEEILATGIPPSNDLEAAIVRDFAPGNYTAILRGLNNTTGMALVEAYGLN